MMKLFPLRKTFSINYTRKDKPVRLLGVRLSELTNNAVQTNLFDTVERKSKLYKEIDDVKNRFGKNN